MHTFLFLVLFFVPMHVNAQHCPWDCCGLLMLKTDLSPDELKKLNPVLVDARKNPVIDTLYNSGAATFDTATILQYDDFVSLRARRIGVHHWYAYDTVYYFARDHFVTRFNYCKYSREGNTELYIRFNKPGDPSGFSYLEVPPSRRIHLHDYNNEINTKNTYAILLTIKPYVLVISRREWGLK